MGDQQPLHDGLGLNHLRPMPEKGAGLLGAACGTPIRQRARAWADAGPPVLPVKPGVVAGLEKLR